MVGENVEKQAEYDEACFEFLLMNTLMVVQ
jgi:hypothetical protein